MRISRIYILFLSLTPLLPSCIEKEEEAVNKIQEMNYGKSAVPYSLRIRELNKNNLVTNPSFELGRHYSSDTINLSFNLPGWKKVGENVFWVNTEDKDNYSEDEASNGVHAIKISRNHADETDKEGEGIISDYIKVIPGNYILKLDIRLENIHSNLERFGSGIYDAVNIRLNYYDRNKVLIEPGDMHPASRKEIDPSFKAFNFSYYDEISDFGWSGIIARTGNYPYEDGNIPDGAKYIKIFLGLKGSGTMYVDYVRFNYTLKNFTFLEQIQPFLDSTMERSSYLIPSPQKAEFPAQLNIHESNGNGGQLSPVFIIPKITTAAEKTIINRFRNEVEDAGILSSGERKILSKPSQKDLNSSSLVFSIGKTEIAKELAENFPGMEIDQGEQVYFIKRISSHPNFVFIDYSDSQGLDRALSTLMQLMDTKEGIYYHYDIKDYPDYRNRTLIMPEISSSTKDVTVNYAKELVKIGINKLAWAMDSSTNELNDYLVQNRNYSSMLSKICETREFISRGMFFPGIPLVKLGEVLEGKGQIPDNEKVKELILSDVNNFKRFFNLRNTEPPEFIILSDQSFWQNSENEELFSFSANDFYRRASLEKEFWNIFFKEKINSQILLKPSIINNQEYARNKIFAQYYYNLLDGSENDFEKILWQGPVRFPELLSRSDIKALPAGLENICLYSDKFSVRKEETIGGSYYSLYEWRAKTGNLFVGLDMLIEGINPEELSNEVILGVDQLSELKLIRLISTVDYLWNSSGFDPVISSWKTLLYLYGERIAKELVLFNDAYFKLYAAIIELEGGNLSSKKEKEGERAIELMDQHWEEIKEDLSSHISLLDELSDLKNNLISRFYQSRRSAITQ